MNLSSSSSESSEALSDNNLSDKSDEEFEESSVSTPNHANLDHTRGYVKEASLADNQEIAVSVKLENIPLSGNKRKSDKGRGRIKKNDFYHFSLNKTNTSMRIFGYFILWLMISYKLFLHL